MQVDRRKLMSGLKAKGFREVQKDHTYFHHVLDGQVTGVYTKISHGSDYKTYGPTLLKLVKRQLKLDNTKQVVDLAECPLTAEAYVKHLRDKGIIS